MTQYILHIGRQKSGTSSLQKFLFLNRDKLAGHGYYYPDAGLSAIAHHDVAKYFTKKVLGAASDAELARLSAIVDSLFEEVRGREEVVLLSSEAFQNAEPSLLGERFPRGNTRVIVYIREQVDFIVSAYQQKIHATNEFRSLGDSLKRYKVDYDKFLKSWEQVFGSENIEVRVYDKRRLIKGDVIQDFLNVLNIDAGSEFEYPTGDQNPSIGGALLEFKRLLNKSNPDLMRVPGVYQLFSRIALTSAHYRDKPLVEREQAIQMRSSLALSNRRVFDRYFEGEDVFQTPGEQLDAGGYEVFGADLYDVYRQIEAIVPTMSELVSSSLFGMPMLESAVPAGLASRSLLPKELPSAFDSLIADNFTRQGMNIYAMIK